MFSTFSFPCANVLSTAQVNEVQQRLNGVTVWLRVSSCHATVAFRSKITFCTPSTTDIFLINRRTLFFLIYLLFVLVLVMGKLGRDFCHLGMLFGRCALTLLCFFIDITILSWCLIDLPIFGTLIIRAQWTLDFLVLIVSSATHCFLGLNSMFTYFFYRSTKSFIRWLLRMMVR